MKKNTMRKRRISRILIMMLAAGMVMPLLGNHTLVVKAAGQEPSVYNYADRKQLMDGSLNMSSTDAKGTVGYINFGKDENGDARRWYVIGKDKGNSTDNVILFSCSDMGNKYFWDSGDPDPIANGDTIPLTREIPNGVEAEGVEYEDNSDPKEVYVNHYGVSDLRKEFKKLEKDTRYFTAAEQKLMLSTVVSNTAADENDRIQNYTVTDKLYAPMADPDESSLLFGSGDKKENMVKAYPIGSVAMGAWTRTPVIYSNGVHMRNQVYVWLPLNGGDILVETNVFQDKEGYHPAFDLDLTDVLFASSAPVSKSGEGVLNSIDAMNLRMKDDGSRFNGTSLEYSPNVVTYNSKSNSYLVIQGKTESGEDWYYSALADTGGTNYSLDWKTLKTYVKSVDIGTEGSFDKCKIWIETNDTDGFTYAFTGKSTPEEPKEIENVILTDIEVPDPEKQAFDRTAKCDTEGVASSVPTVSWSQNGAEVTKPEYDQTYTATIMLEADTGYKFADKVKATVNGHTATAVLDADTGILTVTYDFKVGSDEPKIEFEVNAFSGKYDGKPHSVTVTPTDPADARVSYGVADDETGKVVYSNTAPQYVNAGKYTVYIRIEKSGYTPVEDYMTTITISKRRLRIIVKDQKVVWDSPLPIAKDKYEVEGDLLQGDEVVEVVLTSGPAGLKAGKTGWITVYNGDVKLENSAGDDVSENYIIEGVPGELTVVHNSSLPPTDLTAEKEKTEYKAGETLDLDDLDVTARYEDGYTEKVTDYTTNADRIDMSRPGEKKLIISYGDKEVEIVINVVGDTDGDNNPNDSSGSGSSGNGTGSGSGGNGSSGSGTGSGGGNGSSGSGTGSGGSGSTAQTGDTAPLTKWSFTTVCSEIVILCVLLFHLNKRSGKGRRRQ